VKVEAGSGVGLGSAVGEELGSMVAVKAGVTVASGVSVAAGEASGMAEVGLSVIVIALSSTPVSVIDNSPAALQEIKPSISKANRVTNKRLINLIIAALLSNNFRLR
jgi:hypothetical protein